MAKQNARLAEPSDATVENGMRRGVNVGNMPKIPKGGNIRGTGAATKGLTHSSKMG